MNNFLISAFNAKSAGLIPFESTLILAPFSSRMVTQSQCCDPLAKCSAEINNHKKSVILTVVVSLEIS